ncbi:iron complex outermembrane recepter protein [Tenacibaculum sp. MAR_2009_124]|uniref:SusC/RagA family TonB-linked outer membrane protein n=1 Tax=Tenacibaculum sp. MAR_2009_124 TaxID=1250059 RepID=UPI00089843D0|nr:SusC/RagA family TonB-linked outer membrane protein [Tenacibaculum sp. MAR_2009_124]SEC19737.1 iron complex outermembrane recepter protein [Tenacibaculum sp. MAR_2009_124]
MKNGLLKKLILLTLLLVGSITYAQQISGKVTDSQGPLPGVSVLVKGTTVGSETDFDGNYSLEAKKGDTLVFSFIGYKTKEVVVGNSSTVNAVLDDDDQQLDEVVVVGYGTTTVKDATGAVSAVKSEEFNKGVISSPEQLIQGKTAGVQMTAASGEPGAGISVRIRGSNSIRSNNNPLFVVDGIPLSSQGTTPASGGVVDGGDTARNSLSFINPNDIESISILKDASATAIYGSRAANGVVIITTKSGKSRQGKFEFSSNVSYSSPANEYDLFDAAQYRSQQLAITGNPVPSFDDRGANTNWQDVITRSTFSATNNLSYSKNYTGGNVRATFSHSSQNGVLENSSQDRVTGRINASHSFFQDKLKVTANLSVAQVEDEAPQISGGSGASGNLIGAAYSAPPTWPNSSSFSIDGNRLNPANILENYLGLTETNRYLLNGSVEYQFSDELSAKVNLGYDQSDAVATSAVSANYNNSGRITGNGQASRNTLEATSKLLEGTLNYKKEISDNLSIDALVGYSFQDFRRQGYNAQAWGSSTTDLERMNSSLDGSISRITNALGSTSYQQFGYDTNGSFLNSLFPFDNSGTLNNANGDYRSLWLDTFDNTDELQGFFGRVNLTLNNKFLFTATVRADGSSRFGGNNKYGYFPSGAFAWKMHEEDFVGDNVSTLKLRLSAGVTGNQAGLGHANYLFRQRFGGPGISDDGTVNRPGLVTVSVQNPDLSWERLTDYNLGLDFGFNNDRLNGSVDLYRKETRDLLFLSPAAAPADQPIVFKNLDQGVVVNQGVEFSLGYDFIQQDDMNFSVDFNIAYNNNVVEDLQPGFTADLGPLNGPGLTGAFAQRIGEGQSLFSFYMAEYAETNGVPDFSADDKKFVGKDALPDITTGLSLNFNKGNFDVSAYFTGQFGFYVYNNTANAFLNRPTFGTSRNGTSDSVQLQSQEVSTLYLESGDFVRLQSLNIGYNIPLKEEGPLKSLKLSLSGQNLFLITGYSGLDPEVSSNTGAFANGIPSAGIDYTSFPRPRVFSFGVNATF